MSQLNDWIVENTAVVLSFGIPVFTVLIGLFGSYLSHKSKADEIRLAGRAKLADFRKENFDELQSEAAELLALIGAQGMKKINTKSSDYSLETEDYLTIVQCGHRLMLRIRTERDFVAEFSEKLRLCVHFLTDTSDTKLDNSPQVQLRSLLHDIVAIEWKQIESELKRLV